MFVLQKSRNKASSRQQININSVRDGILTLPGKRYRAILQVSSVNFELKSEDEQDAIIDSYENFINSVGCSLQILVRTREIDMDRYLVDLNERLASETEPIYQTQIRNYGDFIKSLISSNKILTRNFYIVVPYNTVSKVDFEFIKEQIRLNIDIVTKGLARLGIHTKELNSLEALELFYSFYNQEQSKLQPLTLKALSSIQSSFIKAEK